MRRFGSIDWKFPMVMSGLILATAALFVWAAYAQFTSALYESIGARMRSGATFVAPLVGGPPPERAEQLKPLIADPALRAFLRSGRRRTEALAALDRFFVPAADTLRLGYHLYSPDGLALLGRRLRALDPWPSWAGDRIKQDSIGRAELRYSPLFDAGGIPVFQVVSAVVDIADVSERDSTIGYVVETRALLGRGADAIRGLLGGGTFLVGTPGEGVWTDIEHVVPGPPPIPRTDSILVFNDSPRGPGVGVAMPVDGTPWVVWLQQPQRAAVGPVNAFIWRIAPVAGAIALIAALFVWLLSRQITNRLVALTYEVDRMEAGQGQSPTAEPDDGDEIVRLEHAFDRMSARVEQHQRIEGQLMRSQKIEAVGRLAGGIAHDFNNVLTVVRNYSELVRSELPDGSEIAGDVDEVLRATERAAALTRQLLAFSRQQMIAPQVLDVNEVILGSQRMLTRVIPSNVVFEAVLDPGLARINADPGQLEQVLLNLTINAADAMPDGGTLTIRTEMVATDESFTDPTGAQVRGPFVRIAVIDTGAGMDAQTRERIFEPFFTTKPVGKGTGLGLATVHGIVSQSGGRIWVASEPGKGTTFKLYFPAVDADLQAMMRITPQGFPAIGDEPIESVRKSLATILVVEDDTSTRAVTRRLLERNGFTIVEAEHAGAALAALGSGTVPVDLVLTDVMMPGMSGVDLAARIGERWPAMPVLLMTGYSDAEIRAKGALGRQRSLIEKPFTAAGLLAAVDEALRAG